MTAQTTRRTFLAGMGASVLAAATPPARQLRTFPYGAVQLLGGPLKRQFDENHVFFLNLNEDRMLKIYRQRSGMPAPGEDMGGWYDDFCPGAHFGQYVSALARFGAITDSAPTRAKVRRLVKGYAQTIRPDGKFFVGLRYPGYTHDKLICGLLDAQALANDETAIKVLYATTRAVTPHMADHALTPEDKTRSPYKDASYVYNDESYTQAENLFLAYDRTGDRLFFDMAKRYLLDDGFFDPLSEGQNVLPGLHAYSHMNALSSGVQGYLKLNNPKYLRAVQNAVEMIWRDQSYASGGWGPNEGFVQPDKGKLGASLAETNRSFETPCGAYAHFKLMRYLITLTADPRYGDSLERVLYNSILGAWPVKESGLCYYYSGYGHSAAKTYQRDIPGAEARWDHDGRWACCSGTLPQVVADYAVSAYFRAPRAVYVNLYVPSRAEWKEGSVRCSLTQETNYPTESLVNLRLQLSSSLDFSVYLRIPAWAGPNTSVSVNGKRIAGTVPGSFFEINRAWKNGDRIELDLDQTVRTEPVDRQTPDQVALLRGPQVLFAVSPEQPKLRSEELLRPQLRRAGHNDWKLDLEKSSLLLRPFAGIGEETYQTYWKVV